MAASAEGEQNKVEADISPFQQNEVELAFNLSYIDAENVIGDFKRELHAKHRYWTEHRTKYVPYWTLFQASGYGKSRLIKEVAKDIPTLYLCLRPAASTGYPPRTEIIANFLEKTFFVQLRQGEEWRLAYILFQLMNLFYTKNESHSPEQMWDLQMGLWGPSFWTEVLRNIENWKQVTENDVLDIMSQNLPCQSYGQEDVKMIICIDEARSLLPPRKDAINPFRLFRRALRQISRQGKWTGFFVLFLDTLSKVANFAPPTAADPSTRNDNANVDQETGMILFTPFIKLSTMDVFQQSEIPLDITDPEDREMFALARLGRPLGYSYLESNKKNPRRLRNLIEHFKIKLLGGVDDLTRADITRASIAIVSLLACLEISSQPTLASDLVASHAATCYAISEDRENLLVGYPSEPLLAEAGFFLIEDKGNLVKVLKTFNDSLKKGIVEPGPRGELVARLILILAVRHLKKKWFSFPIILRDFVRLFYPDNEQALKYIPDGRVAFTHFVSVDYIPNKEELEGYYHRRIAIIFKLNQQAADLMIPILLVSGQYSFILIQVKNYHSPYARADKKYPSSAKMRPEQVFTGEDLEHYSGEYLSIYWQLGYTGEWFIDPPNMPEKLEDQGRKGPVTRSHTKSEASQTKRLNKKIICMSSFGMDCFKFLDNEVMGILKQMVVSYVTPFDPEWRTANPDHGEIWKERSIIRFRPYASRGGKRKGKK